MSDKKIKIPEFLKRERSVEKMSEFSRMIWEYDEHFEGRDCLCLAGLSITEENKKDYIAAIKTCLEEDRTFNDVWGLGEIDLDDDI